MLRPFLLVGLGGSGGKTLYALHDSLMRMLKQYGWPHDHLPTAWQMLHLDVPQAPDGGLTAGEYRGIAERDVGYRTIDQQLTELIGDNEIARAATAGWRPPASAVTVPIAKGAGQYRAIGRMLTITHIGTIKDAIDKAITRMTGLDSEAELKEAAACLGQSTRGKSEESMAIVIASIAGGTGAGMFMDVCDVLRITGYSWAKDSLAFLYTPEVFDELDPQARRGVRPNALASMAEILAGFWDQDGLSLEEAELLKKIGRIVPKSGEERVGPRFPFLIGRSNGTVTFERQDDVYHSVGRAMAALVSNEKIQTGLNAYAIGNWPMSAASADALPFKDHGQELPFQALGFSRVSLARDLFRQYATEKLARGAVERLLRGHLEGRLHDDPRSDDEILHAKVDEQWSDFLDASDLDIDSARAKEILGSEGFRSIYESMISRVSSFAFDNQEALSEDILVMNAQQALDDRRHEFDGAFQDHYYGRLRVWVQEIQGHLVTFAYEQAAIRGIPVTVQLLRKLESHLDNEVVPRLRGYAQENRNRGHGIGESLGPGVSVPSDSQEAIQVVSGVCKSVSFANLAEAFDALADAAAELRSKVLQKIADAVAGAQEELRGRIEDARTGGEVSNWPNPWTKDVPSRLGGTPNERLLFAPSDFSDTLSDLLVNQYQAADARAGWNRALLEVIARPCLRHGGAIQNVIKKGSAWVPENKQLRYKSGAYALAPQAADLNITLDFRPLEALAVQAQELVDRSDTALGRFVREDLATYFAETIPKEVLTQRVQQFQREFSEALRASSPLVSINPTSRRRIHGDASGGEFRIISPIPFPKGSAAYAAADGVMKEFDLADGARLGAFVETERNQYIEVFTLLASPMEPSVFDSLVKPIHEEWAQASTGGAQGLQEFWRFRRTRPLSQAIPMAPNVRKAMVRGWFTARLLGQIEDNIDEVGRGTISIFIPGIGERAGFWREFPTPLLLRPGSGLQDRLPGVLKNASIAMLEVSGEDLGPVEAYKRLRDLGTGQGGDLTDYAVWVKDLEVWVLWGSLPAGAPQPKVEWSGDALMSADERRQRISAQIARWQRGFEDQVFGPVMRQNNIQHAPRAWELRHDFRSAFDELQQAVSKVTILDEDDV